jgi:predicted  nucleic acid-binding Zn-ribbon protein
MSTEDQEARLQQLRYQIIEAKTRVQSLHQEISTTKMGIVNTENDARLAQHRKPLTIPERPGTGTVELNEEHEEILRTKRDLLPSLVQSVIDLQEERTQLESDLALIVSESNDFETELVDLNEATRQSTTESTRLQSELMYSQKQISERKNEIRLLERLKGEANTAYAQLVDRAENFEGIDGGRLDLESSIENLKSQLSAIREEVAQLEIDIDDANTENRRDLANIYAKRQQFAEAVDWTVERDDLRRELEALTREIQDRKADVNVGEQRNIVKQQSLAKYGPVVAKWKGKTGDGEVPDKTVAQLWSEMEDAKRVSDEIIRDSEREMSELLMKNAKLEAELARRKTTVERSISYFYAEEHQFRKRIEDRRQNAEDEEKKIIAQIQKTKLKLAQKHLRK